jgi:hypothetical protein
MRSYILLLLITFCASVAQGQSINNVRASFQDGKVVVTYDLTGGNEKQSYHVSLFSSHDNYASPVLSVSGDVGSNRQSGVANRIVWDVGLDLGEYKGTLTFRVSADPLPMAYEFTKPALSTSYRRGKQASISWNGGMVSENVTIELLNNGNVVQQISNARNSGIQNWAIPKGMAKGSGYQLRLRSSNGQTINSNNFSIKSKVPLALKVAPVVIAGLVIALLPTSDPGPDRIVDLPAAPSAPTN